jgi:hypothetical protein
VKLKAFLKEPHGHPGIFLLDLLHGTDIHKVLAMDTQFNDDPAYRQLTLTAHLCSLRHKPSPLATPERCSWDESTEKRCTLRLARKLYY